MKKPLWLGIVMVAVLLLGLAASPVFGGNHDLEKAKQAQERHTDELLAKPGVVGTALGRDENGNAVIQVFTARQGVGGIPDKLDGVAVRVKVTGAFEARDDKGTVHNPPVPIGVSSSNVDSIDFPFCYTGTLGARLFDDGGDHYALSNNHVYANLNGSNGAGPGSGVIQPGLADSGCTTNNTNSIGTLTAYVPIDFDGSDNLVDAAIASTTAGQVGTHTPEADADGGYEPSTQALLCVNDACGNLLSTPAVQKRGRTTHLTTGTITGVNAIVQVNYGKGKKALFVKQLIIEPGTFSAGGDSGSLVVTGDADAKPVGLLFAGSDTHTIANRIDKVFSELSNSNVEGTPVSGLSVDGKAPAVVVEGTIAGKVTESDGTTAIAGATVVVEDTALSATTDGNGDYSIGNVPEGTHDVTALGDGFVSETKTGISVTADSTTTVNFALAATPTGTIGGKVTKSDGTTAISGATVVVVGTTLSATTDGNGDYSIGSVPEGTHDVTALGDGFVSETKTGISVTADSTTTVNFALSAVTTASTMSVSSITYNTEGGKNDDKHLLLSVHVVDDLGGNVSGATVSVDLFRDGEPSGSATGTTGANGVAGFSLKNASSGCYTETLAVTHPDLIWDEVTPDSLPTDPFCK